MLLAFLTAHEHWLLQLKPLPSLKVVLKKDLLLMSMTGVTGCWNRKQPYFFIVVTAVFTLELSFFKQQKVTKILACFVIKLVKIAQSSRTGYDKRFYFTFPRATCAKHDDGVSSLKKLQRKPLRCESSVLEWLRGQITTKEQEEEGENTLKQPKIKVAQEQSHDVFQYLILLKNWHTQDSFCLFSIYSSTNFTAKNCRRQRDSNMDRWGEGNHADHLTAITAHF